MITLAAWGLLAALAVALPVWALSLPLRDASLADRVWSLLVAAPVAVYAASLLPPWHLRDGLLLALLLAWALRLAIYISWRNRGHGEDRRTAPWRSRMAR
jgi:steroid 5-alpha reductase family enzyme